ncbi:hypothetical protein MATR_09850 [Marivirga tractuosa]|uniref:Uncharacterized protein n=1 Tax=Marivirga tractuosa (strain ATCC 23168 / DSM 4126 / NBRC 15989 / NCIMB 1408 / VKM B-1430 / H-43) TaxID=643867 RepID=E4TMV5_MARTH|nr:hypothetical protein [Marivirga tractuosa]ADR21386.1 hypothetical protein Ftrac_1396 [Marivirga tractuosa DSM 4126]BDD14160.1 hypothetical protein MATR_09850 [Marivirga tractuosa]
MTQEVEVKKTTLKNDVDKIHDFLSHLTKKAGSSKELLGFGVTDSFAQEIEKIRTAPLEAMLKTWESLESSVKEMVKGFVISFLQTEKDKIEKAVISSPEDTSFKISLVLKDDSFDNRLAFYDFAQEYECLSFSKRYPIIFSFVSKSLADKINVVENIEL